MLVLPHLIHYAVFFIIALTVLVFVHEFGHYWVAKRCGVKIESFSIGFGPELFGWVDRSGTRWKVSLLPLGGYVKMFGDEDASSKPDPWAVNHLSDEDKKRTLNHKPLWQRALVVLAGPGANFAFTIVVFALVFAAVGERYTPAGIGEVLPDSAAQAAGLQPGDDIYSINGQSIKRFEDVQQIVMLHPGDLLHIEIHRAGIDQEILATPVVKEEVDRFGNKQRIGLLGIKPASTEIIRHDSPLQAVGGAFRETWAMTDGTLTAIWQVVKGTRPVDQMGGILSIAKMSGDTATMGFLDFVYFMALLSVNLGLINLFPIPVLDGGHLLFYAIEAIRRKPLGDTAMTYSFRFGLAVVLTLALFFNWNDPQTHKLVNFVRGHFS